MKGGGRVLICVAIALSVAGASVGWAGGGAPKKAPPQRISPGEPPLAPTEFDPDPNPLLWPPNDLNRPKWRWDFERTFAPRAAQFNPDPGAMLRAPAPRRSVLDVNFGRLPRYGEEPVAVPDGVVRRAQWRLEVDWPGDYGWEPLPAELALPREEVRANEPIEINFHNPHYPKFEKTWP
ncbi:MAG: hypothetical protein NZ483_07130 [Verrucomicrobiae bacterium]|nr:hypothetical protein [Verrucomicrobiae bacterium]